MPFLLLHKYNCTSNCMEGIRAALFWNNVLKSIPFKTFFILCYAVHHVFHQEKLARSSGVFCISEL